MSASKPATQSAATPYRPETRLIHSGVLRSQFSETSEALFLTQGFVYATAEECEARFKGDDPGFIYSRFSNPNISMFESRMCALEGAEAARATATGMAAVTTAILAPLRAGDHVVASKAMFGSCRYVVEDLLPRYGIESTLVDGLDLDQWRKAMRPNTRSCFLESPTNPTLDVLDIGAIAEVAHDAGARLIVDNVFATPIWQSPLQLGADVVVYSATKHIDGQGRCLGGAILGSKEFCTDNLTPFIRHTGPSMSPFNAWVLVKGLETMALRVERQCRTTETVAAWLEQHAGIRRVIYPFLASHPQHALARRQMSAGGTVVTFDIDGGRREAFDLLNALELILISNNLGDAKSMVTHPASTTHHRIGADGRAAVGIGDDMIRLSVGLEHPEDLIRDLDRAIAAAGLGA